MIKKGIIAMVAIVAVVGLVYAAYDDPGKDASNDSEYMKHPDHDNSSDDSTLISASLAKKLAERYIEEPGATPGTPQLLTSGKKRIYLVPVIYQGEKVGEIEIDAETGKNLGGSGGAPCISLNRFLNNLFHPPLFFFKKNG